MRRERGGGHRRPQIRAADADIDDIRKLLSGGGRNLAAATFFGEIERVRARGGGDGDGVFAAAPNLRFVVGAQSRVQNGAVFAFVHRLAREHRLAARRQIGGGGQIGEQIDRLFGQRGFRKIEQQIVERERQCFESARIRGE